MYVANASVMHPSWEGLTPSGLHVDIVTATGPRPDRRWPAGDPEGFLRKRYWVKKTGFEQIYVISLFYMET